MCQRLCIFMTVIVLAACAPATPTLPPTETPIQATATLPQTETPILATATPTLLSVTPSPILEVAPTDLPASTEPPGFEEIFDGRISIMMVSVETTIEPIADYELPAAGGGNKYIVFRLTIPRIVDIHLVNILGFHEESATLQLADDQIYDLIFGRFIGVLPTDLTDIRSPSEFVEGSEGVLIFEIPENGTPVSLRLPYSYQQTWEDESPTRGEIAITLE